MSSEFFGAAACRRGFGRRVGLGLLALFVSAGAIFVCTVLASWGYCAQPSPPTHEIAFFYPPLPFHLLAPRVLFLCWLQAARNTRQR